MTSSLAVPYASLRGVQQARISSIPPYASSSGDEAIKLARMAGIELDPWQQTELRHEMGESPDWKCPNCTHRAADPVPCPSHPDAPLIHPWAAFQCCDVDPRQNGKSEKLIARQLAGLFVVEEMLQIYSAHLFDTSMEIMRRLVFIVENCDDLRREVKHRGSKAVGIRWSHGEEGIELRDGRRIRFKARTGGGGRGFSCDTLYLDEAMILPEVFLGATVPTLSARPNPQIWLAGSAPDEQDPTHDGVVLAKLRERALAGGDPSLAYFEHSAEGESPDLVGPEVLDDPEQWALANPGLGIRITDDYIAKERAAMGARQFAVERLGIGDWPDTSEDAGRIISRTAWAAVAEHDSANRITGTHIFAADADPNMTRASIAVSGKRDDGLFNGAVVDRRVGTDWIVPRLKELKADHPRMRVVIHKQGPLGSHIDDLKRAKIRVIEATTEDYGRACVGFIAGVTGPGDGSPGRFRYPFPQPELDEAIAGARARDGEAMKWTRKDAETDISCLVAVTLAFWGAEQAKGRSRVINLNDLD